MVKNESFSVRFYCGLYGRNDNIWFGREEKEMKTVSINFDERILINLDSLAEKLGTSRSNTLMIVLRENVILSLLDKECGKYGKEICK